jgi:succinoglycan biosynthesis protein ExoL
MVAAKAVQQQANASASAQPPLARTVAFFGHDWTESTVVKRINAFQAHGTRVIGFMFRRAQRTAPAGAAWENVDLGTTVDRHYLLRLAKLASGLLKILRHRAALRQAQIYYARNIDMLLLALTARALIGSRAPVVYEVLDVQRVFVGSGLVSRAFRAAERLLMARAALLVVSSPAFISEYFVPCQNYSGRWRLIENKVSAAQALPAATGTQRSKTADPPWVIGWFGTLRCLRSLEILSRIADAGQGKVIVHVRGLPSQEDLTLEQIEAACDGRSNLVYGGPYRSPQDLPAIYGPVHLAWCIDYLDAGGNSDWLLPNRVYEGGLMGCLALARRGTATADMVDRVGLGWSFEEPLEASIGEFIAHLTAGTLEDAQHRLEAVPRSTFVDLTDTRDLLDEMDSLCDPRSGARSVTTSF